MNVLSTYYPKVLPWEPPVHDDTAIEAIRALTTGTANAAQQQHAWRYIMFMTGCSDEFSGMSFYPDDKGGERATTFAEGKRFVGLMLRKLLRPEFNPTPKPPAPIAPSTTKQRLRASKKPARARR
jgi:hypothetical protein